MYRLEGEFEHGLANLYYLAVSEGLNGVAFNFEIIDRFAQELGWNSLATLIEVRAISGRVKAK